METTPAYDSIDDDGDDFYYGGTPPERHICRSQHEPGAKLDADKPRLWLVLGGFSTALTAVGHVGTFGSKKYSDMGWREVPNGTSRYLDAALRHLFAYQHEEMDNESCLPHLAHAAWNILATLELWMDEEGLTADLNPRDYIK